MLTWRDSVRNYLRVRGEYRRLATRVQNALELPPRARRIRHCDSMAPSPGGTTSACAENTHSWFLWGLTCWNYLRVRGEYGHQGFCPYGTWELPPRARRIQTRVTRLTSVVGTTSACAENTAQ